jgi:hypothetical protein
MLMPEEGTFFPTARSGLVRFNEKLKRKRRSFISYLPCCELITNKERLK